MAIATINPTTGETVREFVALTKAEIEDKLSAAHRAAASWRAAPIAERANVVRRAGELLDERKIEYGRLMTLEMGKPLKAGIEEGIAYIDQGGLTLPDRNYYINDDPKMQEMRKHLTEYANSLFTLA